MQKIRWAQNCELPDQCKVCGRAIRPRMLIGVDVKGFSTCVDCLPRDEKTAFYAVGWRMVNEHLNYCDQAAAGQDKRQSKIEFSISPAAARRCRWAITRTIWALEWIGAGLAGLVDSLRGLRRRCQ